MRRLWFILAFIAVVAFGSLRAQEAVTLATPVTNTTTAYHLQSLLLDVDNLTIYVQLRGTNGESIQKVYNNQTTPTGATLLHQINTGNFSVNSLIKAVYSRLLTDGVLAPGSVSGAPQ